MTEPNLQDLQNFFKKRNQQVREERKEITQIIGPFIDSIERSSALEEEKGVQKQSVIDLGKFIQSFDGELHLEEFLQESSNFIVLKKGKQIGVSHFNFNGNLDTSNNELLKIDLEQALQDAESQFEKNQKEHWLLLVIGGVQDSGDYSSFEKVIFSSEYESSFDKIFLFNSFKGEVKFLKTKG